mgnify:CR=1 FL=1
MKVVRNFIDATTCSSMVDKFDQWKELGKLERGDSQALDSWVVYGIFNDQLVEYLPKVEAEFGKQLFPTYMYARIYDKGSILTPHTDREACEYSLTVTLKWDNHIWPFYVEDEEVILDVGDAAFYKGCEEWHWRLGLETDFQYQAFFHYVDQNGEYADKAYEYTRRS